MKSYGRAPTFLMLTGYEQVRSVACAIVGDVEGARNVELNLPETGVCCTDTQDAQQEAVGITRGAAGRLISLDAIALNSASLKSVGKPKTGCC